MHKTADVPHANRINWSILIMLILTSIGVLNAYWLTLLNVTNLKGNKFVNGLLIGIAETVAGFFSGILISYTSSGTAFQALAVLGIIFNSVIQFGVSDGGLLAYFSLFFSIIGVAGTYGVLYVLVADSVPTAQVGGVMVLTLTFSYLTVSFAPMVVLVAEPFPYFYTIAMLILSITVSCFLNKS